MTFITIIVVLILVLLYLIYNEIFKIKTGLATRDNKWSEKNSLYPVFSEREIYMAWLEMKGKGKIWDELNGEETNENKGKNQAERDKNFSEWELADLEYKFMNQSNIDVLNGKKTIIGIGKEYADVFDDLREAIDDREKFIKAIDKYYK